MMRLSAAASALVLAGVMAALSACSRERPAATAPTGPPPEPTAAPSAPAEPAPSDAAAAADDGLAGTSWRLVRIMSMDDTTYAPTDPSLYTLDFGIDGSMRVKADCNMGTGAWSSESAGQIQFANIAATLAECAPGSLHDQYMAQFPWVRSYVLKQGHLFLATMADGSIVEFEPAAAAQP